MTQVYIIRCPRQEIGPSTPKTPTDLAHRRPDRLQPSDECRGRELHPWSVLNARGRPWLRAPSCIAVQNALSSVFDSTLAQRVKNRFLTRDHVRTGLEMLSVCQPFAVRAAEVASGEEEGDGQSV